MGTFDSIYSRKQKGRAAASLFVFFDGILPLENLMGILPLENLTGTLPFEKLMRILTIKKITI